MRCKMCGAKLKKEGDICKNCYEEYKEQEALKADNETEIFRVTRKYSPKFNLLKNGEMILMLLIVVLAGFSTFSAGMGIFITILCLVALRSLDVF